VFEPVDAGIKEDYALLCQAYIQLSEDGMIGNGK